MKSIFTRLLPLLAGFFPGLLAAQPLNDDPCGALELTVAAAAACIPDNPQSWTGATATPGLPQPFCGSYNTGDVWFKFTLTEPADIFITTQAGIGPGAIADGAMALYAGDCNGGLNYLLCNDDSGPGDMPQLELPAQAAGVYYIRFWDYDDKTTGFFGGICVAAQATPSGAANDDPCNALELSVTNGDSCMPAQALAWSGATATAGLAVPSCGAFLTGDVWFKFTLDDTSDIFIATLPGIGPDGIDDGAMALYHADACDGTLMYLTCNNDYLFPDDEMPRINTLGMLPGLYFIRFWDTDDRTAANFGGICVAAKPTTLPLVANDDPCSAIELAITADSLCTPDNPQGWTGATATPGLANPLCGSYATGDIWYKFELTEISDLFIATAAGTGPGAITDGAMALYQAGSDCNEPLTLVACDDDAGPGNMPQLQQYVIPAGSYFIRFWDYSDKTSANFGGICVAARPSVSTVANDNCITAQAFPLISANGDCASVSVNTVGATGQPLNNCNGIADDDVWYSFVMPNGVAKLAFEVTANGNPVNQGLRFYSGNCGQQTSVLCSVENSGIVENLTGGQTYYLKTYTLADDDGAAYDICLKAFIPPANDDPCGATLLPTAAGTDCTPNTPFSWSTASGTPGLPNPGCASYNTGDVWFKFELTYKADIVVKAAAGAGPGGIADGALALYGGGDCGALVQLDCNDDADYPNDLTPEIRAFALSAGVYYLRFWDVYDALSGNIGGICVAATPSISTAPNDLCLDALPFPPIPGDGSCATVQVTTEGATGSPTNGIAGFPDDDVWYSFVAPPGTSSLLYEIKTLGGNCQQTICLTDQCGALAPVQCFSNSSGQLTGLVAGQTYYIRAYTYENGVVSDFEICLKKLPPPPANDACAGALAFPAIPTDGSCATLSVITQWATESGLNSCSGFEYADVWLSFTVPNGQTSLLTQVTPHPGNSDDQTFELFEGSCGTLVSLGCYGSGLFDPARFDNLTPGETYYLRALSFYEFEYPAFDLCLSVPPLPPANDLCSDAIAFPAIPTDGSCATVVGKTLGATGDNDDACYGIYDDDVWFTFTVPPGHDKLWVERTTLSGSTGVAINVYGGNCGNLAEITCQGLYPYIDENVMTGLTGGETYLLRAYTSDAHVFSDFELCLHTLPPAPANDHCPDAQAFPPIPPNGSWVSVSGTTLAANLSPGLSSCNGIPDDDVWYTFTVPPGYDRLLFDADVYNGFNDYGLTMELYAGDCGDLQFIACYGSSNPTADFRNLVGGATYYLRAYTIEEFTFAAYSIALRVPQQVPNDVCENALVFPPLPDDGSCVSMIVNTALASGPSGLVCYGTPDDDVWFQFTVPDDRTAVIFSLWTHLGNQMLMQVFSGGCDSLVLRECFFFPYEDDISGLEPGETYWIRAYTNDVGVSAEFELCLSAAPAPPPNDDCVNAISITGAPGVFTNPGPQTTAGATDSGQPFCAQYDVASVDGPVGAYDVWYSLTTDADGGDATVSIAFDQFGGTGYYSLILQGFDGVCGDFSTLWCLDDDPDNSNTMTLYGLQGTTTYYFRVFPFDASGNYVAADFTIDAYGTALSPVSESMEQGQNTVLSSVRIFPSPATAQVTLRFDASAAGAARIGVLDALGRMVLQRQASVMPGANDVIVPVQHLPPGLYAVVLETGTGRMAGRFVKE